MMRKGLIFSMAAWAALAGTAAHAQNATHSAKTCLTPDEAEAAMLLMAPGALRGLRKTCEPKLGPAAYLKVSGDTLAARLTAAQHETDAMANVAIQKLAGNDVAKGMADPHKLLGAMAEAMIASSSDKLDAKTCGKADQILSLLDPLPARNLSRLIVVAGAMANKDDKDSSFTICEAQD